MNRAINGMILLKKAFEAHGERRIPMTKRTKIICTLGPAVDDEETLRELVEAGMDIARLNFSHGTHREHKERMDRLKRVRDELNSPCAILLDTKGPEIRTGRLAGGAPITLVAGSELVLTEEDVDGTPERITQTCVGLSAYVEPGSTILFDDGLIDLEVLSIEGADIRCRVNNTAQLGERKSVNVPGTSVPLPNMTDRDRDDLLFGIEQDIDFVAASFVRDGVAVREVKEFLAAHGGSDIGVIAKIENADAVENIDGIIAEADAVMVARGDLGVELAPHKVPHVQKKIIRACNKAYKPVITATQMLDSMMRNPRPTRAEVTDVANAIYDGTDCVMLSGETAAGKYPVEALRLMVRIAEASEPYLFEDGRRPVEPPTDTGLVSLAVSTAAVQTAESINAECIIAPTMTGRTARLISLFRPFKPIYSITPLPRVMRSMQLYWGVTPMLGDVQGDVQHIIDSSRRVVLDRGKVKSGDIAVLTLGARGTGPAADDGGPVPANVMYVLQMH